MPWIEAPGVRGLKAFGLGNRREGKPRRDRRD